MKNAKVYIVRRADPSYLVRIGSRPQPINSIGWPLDPTSTISSIGSRRQLACSTGPAQGEESARVPIAVGGGEPTLGPRHEDRGRSTYLARAAISLLALTHPGESFQLLLSHLTDYQLLIFHPIIGKDACLARIDRRNRDFCLLYLPPNGPSQANSRGNITPHPAPYYSKGGWFESKRVGGNYSWEDIVTA